MGENKLRCMTWSEQGSSAVLADAYTVCVRIQTMHDAYYVRFTSYELTYPPPCVLSGLIQSIPGTLQRNYWL